ncbi:MAG: polymer-forming cytoskeletal protein [Paludibacteraceae bacterium]|nr:polymer-forming cytoskeletal protein [Paludibacteraceae bacterium]
MAQQQQNMGTLFNALTAGSKITGTIEADSDIRVDGTIEGDVKCTGKVVIGEQGLVHGNIQCQNAEIMGRLNGTAVISQTLALRATGAIQGDIQTGILIVEPNAIFNGTCSMGNDEQDNTTNNQ